MMVYYDIIPTGICVHVSLRIFHFGPKFGVPGGRAAAYYCYGYIWVRWRTSGRMQAKSSTQTERPGTKRWHGQCPDPLLLQQVHTTNTGSGGGRRGSIRQLWGAAGKTLANYRAPQAEITLIIGRTRAPYAEIVASIVRRRRKYWTACSLWKRWQQETSNVLRVSFIAPGRW